MRWITNCDKPIETVGIVRWRCEGCGWILQLPPDYVPPLEHTLDMPIGTPREAFPDCPKVHWITEPQS
jgi:hypothetical protein